MGGALVAHARENHSLRSHIGVLLTEISRLRDRA
jgi:hypothetical protein